MTKSSASAGSASASREQTLPILVETSCKVSPAQATLHLLGFIVRFCSALLLTSERIALESAP